MIFKIKNPEKLWEQSEAKKALLLPLEKRQEMRHKPLFSATNDPWNDGRFNRSKNIGKINIITKKFHKTKCSHSFEEWEKFYFENGKSFYEIYNLSVIFREKCAEKNIILDEAEALNFCYIRIIDESFIGYNREINALERLRNSFSEYECSFGFTSAKDDIQCGIDIALYNKNKAMVGGFQVKSFDARKRKRVNEENEKRFEKCREKYNFTPEYLEIDEKADMTEDMKKNIKKYINNQLNLN